MCTALQAMHVNIAPYHLTVLLLCLTVKGPNMSTPQWVNGAASFNLQAGRFAIFCSPTLPLNLQHSTQLEITFFTAELAPTIQYPAPRISFKVNPQPPWAALLWQCLMMRSDIFPFLGSSIGYLQSSLIWEFCNLPPTQITLDSSINGSSWDMLLFLFNLLESLSFPSNKFNHLYSSLNYFCWTNFTNNILYSWIMVVVISVAAISSDVRIFLCFIIVFNFFTHSIISATILAIFDQVEAWFSRTDKVSVCTTDSHAKPFLALDLLDWWLKSWC